MADQGDEWASPSGGQGDGGQRPRQEGPPRYGERIPGWTPPAPAAPPPSAGSGQHGYGQQPGGYPAPGAYVPPPKPGLIPLHPLSFGQLLGAAFAVLRYNPRATIVPTLIVNVVQVGLTLALFGLVGVSAVDRLQHASGPDQGAVAAGVIAEGALGGLVVAAISIFGTALLQGMLTLAVARGTLGKRPGAGEVLRRALRSIWPLIGFGVLVSGVEIVVIVVLALLVTGIALTGTTVGVVLAVLLGVFGGLAFAIAAGFLLVKLATVPSAIVLEGLGVFAAIGRSWVLMRGAFWRTLGIFLLVIVMVGIASQIVSAPFSLIGGAVGGLLFPNAAGSTDPTVAVQTALITSIPATIVSSLVQSIGVVAQVSAFALTYLDRRIRREGLDLELQRVVEQGGPDPFEPAAK
ncbi:hypothetical protein [Amnibacterium sp.]|uniref:hypothetical protein n=1 Tax=Amnibacterium sp. TaxID=1872496 RepID=UPI00262F7752|nr:hypothetical protein [Amnibacterium sp.]MCU1472075.1 hypothetical protein [Amnibacterium sp.]